jgi:hypothetical protein
MPVWTPATCFIWTLTMLTVEPTSGLVVADRPDRRRARREAASGLLRDRDRRDARGHGLLLDRRPGITLVCAQRHAGGL